MANNLVIDLSEHNGLAPWDQIEADYKAGKLIGVIMRYGYGTATGMQKDAQFDRNRDESRRRSIPHGFYGYAYPGRSSGAVQANGSAAILGQLQTGESVWLDLEDDPTYGRILIASDVNWSREFVVTLRDKLGPIPGMYMNTNVLGRFDFSPVVQLNSALWQANYSSNDGQPHTQPGSQEWPFNALWQFTSRGSAGGMYPIDLSIFNGDGVNAFLKYGLQGAAPAPVATPPAPSAPAPVAGIGTSYVLSKAVPGYLTAADAAGRKNSNSTAPAGSYYVFNQASGMVNVTRQQGQPGWWINPADNTAAAQPAAPSGHFRVVTTLDGYYTADDAAQRVNKRTSVSAGDYFVFNTYKGMVNVTHTYGQPGSWINPSDNAGAPQNIPAPQTFTVPSGPGGYLGNIAQQFGTSVNNLVAMNKDRYPSIRPDYVQAGWTLRVR